MIKLVPEEIYPYFIQKHLHIPADYVESITANIIQLFNYVDWELKTITLEISCHKGCSYCCCLNIDTFLHERILILNSLFLLEDIKWNIFKEQVREWGKKFELFINKNNLSGFELDIEKHNVMVKKHETKFIPCPFLYGRECMIYNTRPVVCRTYFSLSNPEDCKDKEKLITKPQYAVELKDWTIKNLLKFDMEFFKGNPTVYPIGYYFFKHLPDVEQIRSSMKEFAQTIPINERPFSIHPRLKHIPFSVQKKYPFWPIFPFLERCYKRIDSINETAVINRH